MGLGEGKRHVRPEKEDKPDPRAHFSRARPEHERKKVYITPKSKPWSGLRERKRHVRPEKEEKSGLRDHFLCARPESERKKFT